MPIVNTGVPITAASCQRMIEEIVAKYPFCRTRILTNTAFQRPVSLLSIGTGPRTVLFTAAHHANEWITALVLLKYAEDLAEAIQNNGILFGQRARPMAEAVTIHLVPMVNPDGVDLVVGAIQPGNIQYDLARRLAFHPSGKGILG